MSISVIDYNHGAGGLATAAQLWDTFRGPTSKIRAQELQNSKQRYDIAEEQRKPTLKTVEAAAQIHQNEAAKSITDEATRKGVIAAFDKAPMDLMVPTTDMSSDQYARWKQLHTDNGVSDIASAAGPWNKATANVFGRHAMPQGAIPGQFTTANGEQTLGGTVYDPSRLPDISNLFGGTPAAPTIPGQPPGAAAVPDFLSTDAPPASKVLGPPDPLGAPSTTMTPVQAPAPVAPPTSTPTPSQPQQQLPDLATLARLSANPFARGVAENAIKMRNELQTGQEKQQSIEKGARDVAFGTPEERQKEGDFIRNATLMSHRLSELESMVKKNGNYAFPWEAEHDAKLRSLPMDIADNWNALAGKQGVIREGTVQMAMEHTIPIVQHFWQKPVTWNATTEAALAQTKKVLADYVRNHENLPTTKMPVAGLTPDVRKLVGDTKFGKPSDIATQTTEAASTPLFSSREEVLKSVPQGQAYTLFDPKTGKAVKWTRGNEPWAQATNGNSPTNTLPNVNLQNTAAPR